MRALSRVHPVVEAAAAGEFPDWAVCGRKRRDHAARVAALLDEWGVAAGLEDGERLRWRAAGLLHDALKDADPAVLETEVDPNWPAPVVHGPACAARLEASGVEDEELLLAIAYHSVGHPSFRELGEHLYVADFLEPGRSQRARYRAKLRELMPGGREAVLKAVIAHRLERLIRQKRPIMEETLAFWNRVTSR